MSIAARIKKYFRVVDQDVSDAAYNAVVLNFQKVELSARRLAFLLTQVPLMNLPDDTRLGCVGTKFAYINPKTFANATHNAPTVNNEGRIPPGTTRWILTHAILEGCVIFSNNAMPGLEKSNA